MTEKEIRTIECITCGNLEFEFCEKMGKVLKNNCKECCNVTNGSDEHVELIIKNKLRAFFKLSSDRYLKWLLKNVYDLRRKNEG